MSVLYSKFLYSHRSIGTSSNCRIQYDSIREHCRLIKLLKKKMLDRGASCREVRSIDYTKLTMDGTQLGGILGIGFDHNNNTIQNLVNLKSLSNSYEILTVESEKRQLELMTAKYAVITNETSILIGSTSKIITTVGYLTNENSNTVCSQFDEAYLISIANGGIPVIKLSDNASWNNKVFSDQQTVSQLYTKEENIIKSNLHRGADRKYYCATISPYYSGSQLKRMAPDFWVPLLFLIFDYVHTVFKTPRNHLITKKIALFSAAGKSIIFDWDILRAAVQQFEQNDVSGLRKVARLDINSIWAAGDNSANKMTVKTATATFSSKHQRYLTLLRDSLCEEYGLSEKLLFQVNGEDVYASRVIDIVDGFLPLANVFNRGFDALNGVQKLNRNRSRKLYIDSITGIEEFEKIREISRSIDTLGNLVCNTNGLSLSSNHWLLGAARAVGKSCHGVVSFLIYFTSILVPGSKFSMGILNADDNEQSFSWLRSKCSIFDMKSFMRSLVLLNHHRSRMLEGAIESLFKYTKKNTNKYNTVLYSRNTNSRVSDDENDVSDNDEAQMKINVKRTNNSRTLNGEKSTDCASKLQEHARSNNINNMAAKHMLPQIG